MQFVLFFQKGHRYNRNENKDFLILLVKLFYCCFIWIASPHHLHPPTSLHFDLQSKHTQMFIECHQYAPEVSKWIHCVVRWLVFKPMLFDSFQLSVSFHLDSVVQSGPGERTHLPAMWPIGSILLLLWVWVYWFSTLLQKVLYFHFPLSPQNKISFGS